MFNVQLQVFFGYLENSLYQISMIFKYFTWLTMEIPLNTQFKNK
jgi:hypothetical protein